VLYAHGVCHLLGYDHENKSDYKVVGPFFLFLSCLCTIDLTTHAIQTPNIHNVFNPE
jgi:ssRNA-specific RNase YbeY (16S rRNA maturation enzyme)